MGHARGLHNGLVLSRAGASVSCGARTLPCSIGRGRVIEELRSLLGGERVLTEPAVLAAHSRESWPLRLVQAARGARAESTAALTLARIGQRDLATMGRGD